MSMNKWKKSWIAIFMVLMLMLSGCGADVQGESQPSKDQTVTEQQQETVEQEDWEIIDESEPTINIGEIPEYSGEAYVTIANNIPNFTDSELKTESFETYSDLDSLGKMRYSLCQYRSGFDADRRQRFYWSGQAFWMAYCKI